MFVPEVKSVTAPPRNRGMPDMKVVALGAITCGRSDDVALLMTSPLPRALAPNTDCEISFASEVCSGVQKLLLNPFSETWWFYVAFIAIVLMLASFDLGVFQSKQAGLSFRLAALRSFVWICLALIFNFLLYKYSLWLFSNSPRFVSLANFDPY